MIEKRIRELGYELPEPATPAFSYVPVVVHNGFAFVSGQLPKVDGEVRLTGKVGAEVTVEQAQESARICILQGLSCLKQALGSLDKIVRIVKVTGFVNSAPGFNQQPKVMDGASKLLIDIFGEAGQHARSAVGAPELPRDTPVEVELVAAIKME